MKCLGKVKIIPGTQQPLVGIEAYTDVCIEKYKDKELITIDLSNPEIILTLYESRFFL